MDHPLVNKPAWLSSVAWQDLLAKYGGAPYCAVTGETQNLSVDHIVSRYEGGTNEVSNLQFLVNRINAKKGVRPDAHWSQSFYWDQVPDLNQFRGAQRELFLTIADGYGHWFGKPLSQISTKLYINSWVVGAGKTLGIAAAAWAVNFVQRRELGASTRADKILVVTKETALRDQIARDFEQDITKYGIFPYAPRVAVIEKGHQFGQKAWLDSHDVVVTCLQQLWSKNDNGRKRDDIKELLAQFPVIAFDEPHYGADRVTDLVDDAFQSVCFGFTGTPIDETGELLKRMVGLSVYGYETAVTLDGGLKYLDSAPELTSKFVHELGITEAEVLLAGERSTVLDTTSAGYDKNIEPAKSVVQEIIARMKALDGLDPAAEVVAPHRFDDRFMMNGTHPAHGMIVCDSIYSANKFCRHVNDFFANDPRNYPRELGWHAEVVHAEKNDGENRLQAKPLTPNHPWMRWKNQGALDANCSRLLFVVNMGREGINNQPCGPVGVATSQSSVVEIVQRAIGRQLRAVTSQRDGKTMVPPAPLDTVSIVTHVAFKNTEKIKQAINFVCDMEASLENLPSIDDLLKGDEESRVTDKSGYQMPLEEKLDVVGRFSASTTDEPPTVDQVVNEVVGLDTGVRAERIREWAQKVHDEPEAARAELKFYRSITPVITVFQETIHVNPSDEELQRYVLTHIDDESLQEEFIPVSGLVEDGPFKKMLRREYTKHIRQFHLAQLPADGHIDDIRKNMARTVKRRLTGHYIGDGQLVHVFVGSAVKQKLGVPDKVVARNKSDWDTPQVHAILHRPEVQAEILNWVCGRLIDEGECPSLESLRTRVDA